MRVLVISDIHANYLALQAVLEAAAGYEAVWFLGDLVGYGPNPNECVERIRALPDLICLVGNHDKAVLGEMNLQYFNGEARAAINWTRSMMTPETLDYLRALPAQDQRGDFTLVHGSLRQPIWEYILDAQIARENFPLMETPYCLVGHTHAPVIFGQVGGHYFEEYPDYSRPRRLDGGRLIINPGSVGQPRDNNPQASYALLDTDQRTWHYQRVPYDVAGTQSLMRAAGLPERLALRLTHGW